MSRGSLAAHATGVGLKQVGVRPSIDPWLSRRGQGGFGRFGDPVSRVGDGLDLEGRVGEGHVTCWTPPALSSPQPLTSTHDACELSVNKA